MYWGGELGRAPFASSGAWPGRRVVLCPCVWHHHLLPVPTSSTFSTTPLCPWFLGHRVGVPAAEPSLTAGWLTS